MNGGFSASVLREPQQPQQPQWPWVGNQKTTSSASVVCSSVDA